MDISNKTLAWLVVTAIAIAVIGTTITLTVGKQGMTGYYVSNDTGNASVYISSTTSLRFTTATLNIGSGSVVTASYNNCTLAANDSTTGTLWMGPGCSGFNNGTGQAYPLVLENAGNTYMNVTLNFSADNSTFPGGNVTMRSLKFQVANNETSSCVNPVGYSTWTEITALTPLVICDNLSWSANSNTLKVHLQTVIPLDAEGAKTVNILAQGTS